MTQVQTDPRAFTVFREKVSYVVFYIGASKKWVLREGKGLKRGGTACSGLSRVSIQDQPLVFLPHDVKGSMKG